MITPVCTNIIVIDFKIKYNDIKMIIIMMMVIIILK